MNTTKRTHTLLHEPSSTNPLYVPSVIVLHLHVHSLFVWRRCSSTSTYVHIRRAYVMYYSVLASIYAVSAAYVLLHIACRRAHTHTHTYIYRDGWKAIVAVAVVRRRSHGLNHTTADSAAAAVGWQNEARQRLRSRAKPTHACWYLSGSFRSVPLSCVLCDVAVCWWFSNTHTHTRLIRHNTRTHDCVE